MRMFFLIFRYLSWTWHSVCCHNTQKLFDSMVYFTISKRFARNKIVKSKDLKAMNSPTTFTDEVTDNALCDLQAIADLALNIVLWRCLLCRYQPLQVHSCLSQHWKRRNRCNVLNEALSVSRNICKLSDQGLGHEQNAHGRISGLPTGSAVNRQLRRG